MLLLAQKPECCWIVQLICRDPEQASGACHRSLQLHELLEQGGFRLTPIDDPPRPGSIALAAEAMACGLRDGFYRPWGIDSLRNAGAQASFCRLLFERNPTACGLILEGTGYGSLTATAWCRRHGKRSILVPANLESLAPNRAAWPYAMPLSERFRHELPWLRQADAVVTIAPEEAWLLELHGIPCHHLPYYPSRRHHARLSALAEARRLFQATPDAEAIGYLMVADFGNPANQAGAHRLLAWLRRQPQAPAPLHVAGRGSAFLEQLIEPELRPRLVLHGEVSDGQLEDLQRRCQALLILHPPTSGMLTRIIDAALADLPVVGDWMSFKSYHHCFADGLLMAPQPPGAPPPQPAVLHPPAPPTQAANRFLELLNR